jgi:glycosyltransferase involved in cell wall biosynthesis
MRMELGLASDAFAFLCFGSLRRYKDVGVLLEAFSRASLEEAALVVAGKARDAETAELVRAAAASSRRIRIHEELDYVPDEQVRELFEACDVAIVSRGDGGTSGALMLALSLGKAVIVSDQPAYADLVATHDCGWTFVPQDINSLAAAMEKAAGDPSLVREQGAAALRFAETLRWPDLARQFAEVMVGQPGLLADPARELG